MTLYSLTHQLDWQQTSVNRQSAVSALYPINESGVYLYTTIDNKPVYVGRAEDLEKRFKEHLSDNEPNKELLDFLRTKPAQLYYAIEENEQLREGIELFLFNYLSPRFNDNTPSAEKEIPANFPEGVKIN